MLKKQSDTQTKGRVRIITTEEHRPLLVSAIKQAKKELIIVSPWTDQRVVDNELRDSFKEAFDRGVRVRIVWGLGLKRPGSEPTRSRMKADPVIKSLKVLAGQRDEALLDVREANTHEKILVCDSDFCAWGSFDLLNYRGEIDSDYRRESSSILKGPMTSSAGETGRSNYFLTSASLQNSVMLAKHNLALALNGTDLSVILRH